MSEFITRAEFIEAVRRLDTADAELRAGSRELERVLRADYEDKIASAVTAVGEKVETANANLKEDVNDIKEHLTWQDRMLIGSVVGAILMVAAYVVLHYVFHVG